mmetsp:Transcript_60934/g.83683  ORF Transcript_60934/g.83683 Transcript_60934/m.83683 type:complete len:97 (-) Transcript_60934:890-1180(-)
MGSISDLIAVIAAPFVGALMDLYGRKIPILTGFIMASIAMMLMPSFYVVYPWLCLLRGMMSLGSAAATSSPLISDYVQKDSIGRACGYKMSFLILA